MKLLTALLVALALVVLTSGPILAAGSTGGGQYACPGGGASSPSGSCPPIPATAVPATTVPAGSADAPAFPPALDGGWSITAIETRDGTIKVGGKLAIGSDLMASVGCNTLGAPVRGFDGTHLSIGELSSTAMGCPDEQGRAEAALATVLGGEGLTLAADALVSSAGRIDLARAQPASPAPTSGTSSVDPATCARLLGAEWDLATGPASTPGAVAGSSGSGSGTSGSGGSSSGSGGAGTTGTKPVASGPPVDVPPVPVVNPDEPVSTIAVQPATAMPVDPSVPGDAGVPQPVPPEPVTASTRPVTASPAAPPSLVERCRSLLAQLREGKGTTSAPGTGSDAIPPGVPTAAAELAHSSPTLDTPILVGLLAGGLIVLLAGVLLGRAAWSRRRRERPPAPGA